MILEAQPEMPAKPRRYPELVEWLQENGFSEPEIDAILQRVEVYEQRIGLDAVMASIADGSFDLNGVIAEALKKAEDEAETPPPGD